jgi:hypothetical protein
MRSKLEAVCVDAVQAVARAALSGAAAGAVVGPKTGLGALDGLAAA